MTVISRATARLLPGDADGRVLLRHGSDAEKVCWFPIGGGVEPGKGLAEAAVGRPALPEFTRAAVGSVRTDA